MSGTAALRPPRAYPPVRTLPPLSTLTYYRRNFTRTLPVGGAIMISVFLISAIATLLGSVDESITSNYGFTRHFSVLGPQSERDIAPRVVAAIKRVPNLQKMVPTVPYLIPIHAVFGDLPVPIYGTSATDMQEVAGLTGNKLISGSWPRVNEPEVIMSSTWARNLSCKVGEFLPQKKDRISMLREPQKLVGILDGGENIAFTSREYLLLELPEPVTRNHYLVVPGEPGALKAMNSGIKDVIENHQKHGLTEAEVHYSKLYTFDDLVRDLRESLGFLYKFLAIADGLVIGAIALLSAFLANIYFEQRLGEFGLLSAFGFRRARLARRLGTEIGALIAIGWLLGIVLTAFLFFLFRRFYMEPQGLVLARLSLQSILFTVPTPIIVGIASLSTVLLRLYRLDPIEIMERR